MHAWTSARTTSGRPIWKAINNQVFWRTNELCGHARRNAKSTQSIADIIGNSTPDVDDSDDWVTTSETLFPSIEAGYEDVERIDLIERIHAQISDHLVSVATMRCEGCTNKEIAAATGIQKAPSISLGVLQTVGTQSTRQHRHHDLRPITQPSARCVNRSNQTITTFKGEDNVYSS